MLRSTFLAAAVLAAPMTISAHEWHVHADDRPAFNEALRQRILNEWKAGGEKSAPGSAAERTSPPPVAQPPRIMPWSGAGGALEGFTREAAGVASREQNRGPAWAWSPARQRSNRPLLASAALSPLSLGMSSLSFGALALFQPPAGNGTLLAASFGPFKPKVRFSWDSNFFYAESDGIPDRTRQPNLMVGITSWQQQVPLPTSYFASTTNGSNNTGSLGYQQPNYWRIPLVPVPAASPISLTGNFLRGAVALGADGVAIFNPRNNTGQFSQAIGELDAYGGHCGLGDDYHYHIFPTHLTPVLGSDKPIAWGLDGYPVYGYLEPDGSAQQALDADGGHDHGTWGYHYHARGTYNAGTATWTPASPYMMSAMHGTVVNFDSQIDPQPTGSGLRAPGTGGYTAVPVAGAVVTAFKNPVALSTDGSGHLVENIGGVASEDQWLMRYTVSGTAYDLCWRLNRNANPKTMTMTWRHPTSGTTTTTYNNAGSRITTYPMAASSMAKLPDTSQTIDTTATFGEDADYTINPQSFTDNGNGTITDNVSGLMWQKVDNGESTWDAAVTNAAGITVGGFTDWRLPTPAELFSIFNHNNGNPAALDSTYFPNNPGGTAGYFWTSDTFGTSTTNVWAANAGGGLGPKPKSETISAGGTLRYHARYVRGGKLNNGHNYLNNGDGTITDTDTALMWTQVPGAATTWEGALTYSENLALGGFTDWRLPNIKELQTLTDYTLAISSSATNIKPSVNRTVFGKTLTNCTTNGTTTITCADTTGLIVGMPLVDPVNVASTYIPNATVPTVASVVNSTTFTISTAATGSGSGLTLRALVRPTAYWSSTSNRGTTTEAWVVETGVNTTSTPPRNSQGIISYDLKTASFPVFAVRTTSVTTQIAVEQPSGTALADGVSTVAYGGVNVGGTLSKTFIIRNTSGTSALNVTGVTIDGTNAADFAVTTSPVGSIAASGTATMVVQFAATVAGARTAGVHIASSDTSVGAAFDINLTGTGATTPATITNVTANPTVPSNTDTPNVTATVTAGNGTTITSVQLTYSTGAQSTGPAFREVFGNSSTASGYAGSMNNWTSTAVRAAGDSKLRGGTGNRTPAIVLTNCVTNGTTAVTCASTAGLIPGMLITGTNIVGANITTPATVPTTISSITDGTTFVLNQAASGSGAGLTLTAAGLTLTGCTTTSAGTSVTCLSTTGLAVGMGVAGAVTNPPNPTIASITSPTQFVLNNPVTTGAGNVTLTATGCGMEFSNGTANYTDTMAETTGVISATAPTAGNVEFYVRNADLFSNNGWTFQISPDGGTTWNTRLAENFAASSATNCTLNATTTVTCSNTSGLTVGNSIQGIPISIAACSTNATTTVTTANTGNLAAGMIISGPTAAGIPNNARITAVTPGVSFTLSAAATGTTTNQTLTANYLPGNATVTAITPNVSFTLNTAAFYSGSGITLSSVNHGFALKHYDLVAGDMSANMKMRFQMSGYSGAAAPARPPAVDIDDIVVTLTTGSAPVAVAMTGPANGGVYSTAALPAFASGTTVSYTITATDSAGGITTTAGSYTTGPAPAITTVSLPSGVSSGAYSQTLAASGGSGSGYTWSLASGALPANFTLSSAGVLSGTSTTAGTYNFTVRVTDSAGRISTKALSLTISATTAPNVVIILTDDQGWADIGYHTYGSNVRVQTPNMDKLGVDGIRLEKFYATTVCAVTRGCLLTGRNSLRTNVGNQKGLGLAEHLMPQSFKAAGYQTFMCGKWHIGGWDNNIYTTTMNGATIEVQHEGAEYHPLSRGWDFHKGQYGGAINYFTHTTSDPGKNNAVDWWQNGVQLPNDNVDLQGNGGYSTDLLADKAVSQIVNRDKAKPMLLYLAFNAVHAGVAAPQSYIDKYTALGVPAPRRTICAAVDCMDVAMGRVLAALDSEGITNNTLVVFMSDNGGDTGTGSLNLPLRGTKGDSYDGGLHMPAAIRWPGKLAAGVTSNQYVWVGDIFPTVCAAAGVTPLNTKPFDGVNLWPQLQSITAGNPNGASRGVPLVTGASAGPVALDTFTDPVNGGSKVFKLIRTPGTPATNQLFNMTDDPYETTDVLLGASASSYTTIVTTLTAAITGIVAENYAPYIGPTGITQSVAAGGTITLYAPFSSYRAPTVQWRRNGANISPASPFFQVTNGGSNVNGVYMATCTLTNVTPADAASYDVTVTSTGGAVTSPAGALTVNATPQQSWWFANFNTLTYSGNAALLADPDNDGTPNLTEWAFGLDPAVSDPAAIALNGAAITKRGVPRLGTDGVNFYAMFGRRKDYIAAGLTYTVQFSADLSAWENSTTTPAIIASDSEMDAVSVPFPLLLGSGAKPRFFRLSVSTP